MSTGLAAIALVLAAGCAKLPLQNTAPSAPVLTSDGVVRGSSVEIVVRVEDADGDKVTLQLQATPTGSGTTQLFDWTSFFASGGNESFLVGLAPGQWRITAQARDEWDESSPVTNLDLTVVSR